MTSTLTPRSDDPSHRDDDPVLVLGATGKTGRRVAERLRARGVPVREGSRRATPAFDWNDETTWDRCLAGARAVYVSFAPDLALPGTQERIRALVAAARRQGVEHLVLLSGRGEAEAQACERIVMDSGAAWTVVRASWFCQNFSEGEFLGMVLDGRITLPAGPVPEPFVDVEDIAEIAAAALTEPGHAGEIYEVTGPRALTFEEVAEALSEATGRRIEFVTVPHEAFLDAVRGAGAPEETLWMLDYLMGTVLDGRNAHVTDGVQRALGRPPRDFAEFARAAAASGCWRRAA
jgi:uncharacterized protein YbjT (DUF2867 family)